MAKIALEQTTNTHQIEADEITKLHETGSIILIKIKGNGIVTHGEHGMMKTEHAYIVKYVQKEINPISKKIEDAND